MKNHYKIVLLLYLILIFSTNSFCKIIYVKANTNGNNDGTSWQNAYLNFQSAINEAIYSDTIWIAQGIYKPTNGSIREIPFALKNGVKWFGGFQGNETELTQRDFDLYPTILSGDIGVAGDSTDNSYHVVYALAVDSTTTLDGIHIVGGRADFTSTSNDKSYGGGLIIFTNNSNQTARLKIKNCVFKNNFGTFGGGIGCLPFVSNQIIEPFIENTQFISNQAVTKGGAIYKAGIFQDTIQPFIRDCSFEHNIESMGAIAFDNASGVHQILDSDFLNNKSFPGEGGGIYIDVGLLTSQVIFEINNCSFEGCEAAIGEAISISNFSNFSNSLIAELNISNCDFIENKGSGGVVHAVNIGNTEVTLNIEQSNFIQNNINSNGHIIALEGFFDNVEKFQTLIDECTFLQNGSMIYIPSSEDNIGFFNIGGKLQILNSTFSENAPKLFFEDVVFDEGELSISNSVFYKNGEELISGNGIDVQGCTFYGNKGKIISRNNTNISNSIFWENQDIEEIFYSQNSTLQGFNIHHSLLKTPDCIINGIDMCGDGMLYNLYPEFRDTMNGDLSLRSCSPALNQGDNAVIDSMGILFDIEGTPRIIDLAVDLGAYETQAFEVLFPQVDNVSCTEGMDGAMNWVQHGTPPYSFEWDNGTTTGMELSNLSAGSYNITITDADSCIGFLDLTLNEPLPLFVLDSITNATSTTLGDGKIDLMTTGGIPDYDFLWSNGDTTALLENLLPGFYSVTITDANGCELEMEYEVGLMTSVDSFWEKQRLELLPNISQQNIPVKLFFEISEAAAFEVSLRNELGQLFFHKKIKQDVGKSWLEIPSPSSSGLYFLEVKNEERERKVLKWVVF